MSNKTKTSPASAGHPLITNTEVTPQAQNDLKTNSIEDNSTMQTNTANTEADASKNTSGILPGIEDVDPELKADAGELANNEIAHLAETSRENGSKGGRQPINRNELAEICVEYVFSTGEKDKYAVIYI